MGPLGKGCSMGWPWHNGSLLISHGGTLPRRTDTRSVVAGLAMIWRCGVLDVQLIELARLKKISKILPATLSYPRVLGCNSNLPIPVPGVNARDKRCKPSPPSLMKIEASLPVPVFLSSSAPNALIELDIEHPRRSDSSIERREETTAFPCFFIPANTIDP